MDFPTDPSTPYLLKILVWIAMGCAAITVIWKTLRSSGLLHLIAEELQSNGGTSVKDKVNQAASDSKKALDLTIGQDKVLAKIMYDQSEMEKRMARFIIHEANNTLQHAKLVEEEKRLLSELEKQL